MTQIQMPARLQEIVEDFQFCEGREKVELLLDFSERMPPLPERLRADHDSMDFVEECMTPVYVKAETEGDGLKFYFDVPQESPTVRGFAAIMADGLDGATPEAVLSVPNDFFQSMGLETVLSMQRLNGLSAILAHMKRISAQQLGGNA